MAGLLDFLSSPDAQMGLGLLAAAGPRSDGAGFGQRMQEGMGYAQSQQDNAMKRKMAQMQMDEQQRQMVQAQQMRQAAQGAYRSPEMANALSQGPVSDGGNMQTVQPGFDAKQYANSLYSIDPFKAMEFERSMEKEDAPVKLSPGEQLFSGKASGYKPLLSVPGKESALPAAVQEYNFAKEQGYPGSFLDFQTGLKRAGATNVSNRTEVKMGEGVASQVGPMVKDSKIQTSGAVKMFDAAGRISSAIDSGSVSSGPFSTQVQTVKQLVQKIGGGNDDGIRQTRQVIKSLAQMSVEARKQLQGQGQVTESEAAAVAKADAGDINDLSIGELKDLVTLTKRAAHYTAKSHKELLTGLDESDQTRNLSKFYQVSGTDALLNYKPVLPKIGGNSGVGALVDKYRTK